MLSAFASHPVRPGAYSSQPMAFLDGGAHEDLASVIEIDIIENGSRALRENWQERQLKAVLANAREKSAFWRKRIPKALVNRAGLSALPVLTREEVMEQVRSEGSLLGKGTASGTYASTGSTGTAVSVHVAGFNGRYNAMRSLAQYFIDGRPLDVPRTFIRPAGPELMLSTGTRLRVERHDSWLDSLGKVFANGPFKFIEFADDAGALLAELKRDRVGYLACPSSFMALILGACGAGDLEGLGIAQWLHHSDDLDEDVARRLRDAGIPVNSNYSCSETGAVATGCTAVPGHYHVAHSNVIVECDRTEAFEAGGERLGRILITHLHGYATPLIRYDAGDVGLLHDSCPCGHDGPALSHLHGRRKFFLRHRDGRLTACPAFTAPLLTIVPCSELWIHQPDTGTIVAQFGGIESLSASQEAEARAFLRRMSQGDFTIDLRAVPRIDWSRNPKRLGFTSAVA